MLLYYVLLYACSPSYPLSDTLAPPPAPRQHTAMPWLMNAGTGARGCLRLTPLLLCISQHPPDEIIPPKLDRFLCQQPRCSLINAKLLLAAEAFTYRRISLRPNQLECFFTPAPPLPSCWEQARLGKTWV